MTRHLAKLLDAIWYLSMGLFLGLTGGLVLSVILTFRGVREIDASPGVEPFSDPMFAEYHNDAVAGYIGQELFMVGGTVALVLIGIAVLSRLFHGAVCRHGELKLRGSRLGSAIRFGAMVGAVIFMAMGAYITLLMNDLWPELYDLENVEKAKLATRPAFEQLHQLSERWVGIAWFLGFLALSISPWCRRIADTPLQSGDGKKEVNQKEVGQAEKV